MRRQYKILIYVSYLCFSLKKIVSILLSKKCLITVKYYQIVILDLPRREQLIISILHLKHTVQKNARNNATINKY